MADSHSARTKAFISYSHADEKHLERLSTHLEYYRREQKLDIWSDRRIPPGADWKDEIRAAIASAKVAILLVSADFLASRFIAHDELPPLLEAAEKDGLIIFQIILSPCAFKQSRLARYQAINSPSDSLIRMSKFRREETWGKLAEQVADALTPELLNGKPSHTDPPPEPNSDSTKAGKRPEMPPDPFAQSTDGIHERTTQPPLESHIYTPSPIEKECWNWSGRGYTTGGGTMASHNWNTGECKTCHGSGKLLVPSGYRERPSRFSWLFAPYRYVICQSCGKEISYTQSYDERSYPTHCSGCGTLLR